VPAPNVEAGPRDPAGRAVLEAFYAANRAVRDEWLRKVHDQSWELFDQHPARVAAATGLAKAMLERHAPEPHWGGREIKDEFSLYHVPECKGCEQGGNDCGCHPDQPRWPCNTYWDVLEYLSDE
jgi:hypothetical protein